jgi:hypothetical protein
VAQPPHPVFFVSPHAKSAQLFSLSAHARLLGRLLPPSEATITVAQFRLAAATVRQPHSLRRDVKPSAARPLPPIFPPDAPLPLETEALMELQCRPIFPIHILTAPFLPQA